MIINQSQLEPEFKQDEPQLLLLPKQLKSKMIQIQEQQSLFPNRPERFPEHPQSLFMQPVAAKSLIIKPPKLLGIYLIYIM